MRTWINRERCCKLMALLLLMVTFGCGRTHNEVLVKPEALYEADIAVLNKALSEDDLAARFPEAKAISFKTVSEFLLAMAVGKCDAGIAPKDVAGYIIERDLDYGVVPGMQVAADDSVVVIAHQSRLPVTVDDNAEEGVLRRSINRIDNNLIDNSYWQLILNGLAVTMLIFVFGLLLAFVLAILIIWMGYKRYLKWLAKPIFVFVKTIHDVPSVVLIFFFYYLVFATVPISGVTVCIIALGVYSSGSLMNVIKVHLGQVNHTQHDAAKMLGLDGWKKYRYVILPQAVKPMLPLLASESKVLLRATSYAGYIAQIDLVKVAEIIRNETYDALVPLVFVSLVFLLLSKLIVKGLSMLYKKMFSYD